MTTEKTDHSGGHQHHRREWVVPYRRIGNESARSAHPFGTPRMPWLRGAGRCASGVFRGMAGAPDQPQQHQLPRQHLCAEVTGVKQVISVSAVGSMKEAIWPGDVVLPDQFIDLPNGAYPLFSMKGIRPTLVSANRSLASGGRYLGGRDGRRGAPSSGRAPMCAWRGRSFSTKRRIPAVSTVGRGRHWNDEHARGEARREAELCYATVALPDRL